MYFNPQVKEEKKDFFNFEVVQEELKKALLDKLTPMTAVYGLRRTGKTSLIKVVLNSIRKKYIWLDSRDISSREDFYNKLSNEINKLKRVSVEKISIKGVEVSFGFLKNGLDYLNKHRVTLAIDEAQLLKRLKLDNTLAYIYDNFPNIKIIVSGSETGMLMNFLGRNSAKAPLYGRAIFEIKTHRLDRESAFAFLKEGSKQAKLNLSDEEIITVIKNLDGIIGWLTKYGWYRTKLPFKESLNKTIDEGKLIAREEFLRFAANAETRYKEIMKAIKGGVCWDDIKRQVRVSDKQLASMLKRLLSGGFIEKKDNVYTISDPLLEAAI